MCGNSVLCFLVQSCKVKMSSELLLTNSPVLELQLSSAKINQLSGRFLTLRFNNNNPNQNFLCVNLTDVGRTLFKLFKWILLADCTPPC